MRVKNDKEEMELTCHLQYETLHYKNNIRVLPKRLQKQSYKC